MAAVTPLIAVVGETASGKSALALEIAKQCNGEIICADSRTVYIGMDIGTAKPSAADRQQIEHHLLDIVAPDVPFSVADFKRLALSAIEDITARGKVPILVGGSGLYVDAVLFDYDFNRPSNPKERARLNRLSVEELQDRLKYANIPLPANSRNPRHLIRAIETGGNKAIAKPLRQNTLVIGLRLPKNVLEERIKKRVDTMLSSGLIEEVKQLVEKYKEAEALRAPGYKAFIGLIKGQTSLDDATAQFIKNDLLLAKRQRTWFKRNKSIRWIDSPDEGLKLAREFLNNSVR